MINSIHEQRKRLENGFHITLSIPKNEYTEIYGNQVNENNAKEIVHNYMQYKDDDGDLKSLRIYDHDDSNLIEIEAILNYIGNAHKDYDR